MLTRRWHHHHKWSFGVIVPDVARRTLGVGFIGGPHMPWFWRGDLQGGGVLNDMMCHAFEVGRYLHKYMPRVARREGDAA